MISIDLSLRGLLHGNVFNFLILAGLIFLLLRKLDVSIIIDNAKLKIIDLINKSEEDKLLSEKALEEAKNDVLNLPLEKDKIAQDALNTINAYQKKTDVEIEKISEKLENNVQKIIENETRRINTVLQKELVLNSLELAHTKTLDGLKNDSGMHRKFINEAIDKIEEIEL